MAVSGAASPWTLRGTAFMTWVMRLAWMAINAIAMLPVLGRWFDSAPVRDPNARPATLSVLLDVLGAVSHRAWGLPAIVALSVFVVSLTATAYAMLTYRGVPWSRRNHVLWPLPGLGVALAICTLLDEHLPEFGR